MELPDEDVAVTAKVISYTQPYTGLQPNKKGTVWGVIRQGLPPPGDAGQTPR